MTSSIYSYSNNNWEPHTSQIANEPAAQLVLCFAPGNMLLQTQAFETARKKFPKADIVSCSSAGEICQDAVRDDSCVAAVIHFEKTNTAAAAVNIKDYANSYEAGLALVQKLAPADLNYILVLSDGSLVNGSELVKGLNSAVNNKVPITGGLAGDGTNFSTTLVGLNGLPAQGNIVAIGFYGGNIVVKHGIGEGWQTFGLEKEVTKSDCNKLFEIDNKNALDIYKKYLGPEAGNLPGSALLFPLSVTVPGSTQPVVRTILSIDEENSSMTFAGDIPAGSRIRFMKANFDKLTGAAALAAQNCLQQNHPKPAFSLLVSCVGRKLILGSRTEEEVEAVIETFGSGTAVMGFYSYGEIAPFNNGLACHLHNQTITITSFYELA